jgi:hypothetical protein
MKEVFYLLFHLLTTLAKLIRPGGSRAVIAENLLLKQQLIIHSRSRQRAPNLTSRDRATRILDTAYEPKAYYSICHYHQAIYLTPIPRRAEKAEVPAIVFTKWRPQTWTQRTILAYRDRSCQRQPVECGSIPQRIYSVEKSLGHGGNGSVHPPHHWLRSARR